MIKLNFDPFQYALTTDQQNRCFEFMNLMNEIPCFEYEGIIFHGNITAVAKRYVKENPSDKFFIWVQKNVEILIPATS